MVEAGSYFLQGGSKSQQYVDIILEYTFSYIIIQYNLKGLLGKNKIDLGSLRSRVFVTVSLILFPIDRVENITYTENLRMVFDYFDNVHNAKYDT